MIRIGAIFSLIGFFFFLSNLEELAAQQAIPNSPVLPAFPTPTYDLLRDTLFLLDSVYLEVRLDKQVIVQHFRSGRTKRFPCSTGNPRLPDAIATREGIFSIQWKSRRYMSRQFEVWLNYWMPFDGGIGFHGLDGHSYYKYLGRRPSSHGCVRISNETGRDLFATVPRGTIVYVHSGFPARVLHFAAPGEENLRTIGEEDVELLKQRLDAVTRSDASDGSLRERLAISAGTNAIRAIGVGRANSSMRVQYTLRPRDVSLLEGNFYSVREPEPAPQPAPLPPVETALQEAEQEE